MTCELSFINGNHLVLQKKLNYFFSNSKIPSYLFLPLNIMNTNQASHHPASIVITRTDLPIKMGAYEFGVATPNDLKTAIGMYEEEYDKGYPYFPTTENMGDHFKATHVETGEVHSINRVNKLDNGDYEFAGDVTLPNYRGQGLGGKLTTVRWGALSEEPVCRVTSEPVNNDKNFASLRNLRRAGRLDITGIFPAKHPSLSNVSEGQALTTSDAYWIDTDGSNGSSIIDIENMNLPQDYRKALKVLIPPRLWQGSTESNPIPENYGNIDLKKIPARGEGGSEAITVPVNHADTREVIAQYRRDGFLLRGLQPRELQIDEQQWTHTISLYRPPSSGIDFNKIYGPDWLEKYLQFMRTEYQQSFSGERFGT